MIEVRSVTHRVGTRVLLHDVSLAVNPGEVLVLAGPNGAGKSTLLQVLSGDLVPTSGEVLLDGRPFETLSLRERARLRATLPQRSDLPFPYSAHEVVLLGRSPRLDGHETERDRAIARITMSVTDTLPVEERAYPTLSGGERQRVQAARVVAQVWEGPGCRALYLDEPTASLDLAHQHAMLGLARRMAEDRCAVVCVIHDLNLAAQYATNIAILHEGRIRAMGPPSRVLSRELLADVFEVDALVVPHPELSCPLVISRGRTRRPLVSRPMQGALL